MPDLNSLVKSKLAFGVLIGSLIATGGTAMAAFAGALPDPIQQSAHVAMGAPESEDAPVDDELDDDETDAGGDAADDDAIEDAPTDDETIDDDAKGPDVTGSAAFGLCTAYTNGGLSENSTAYKAFDDVEGGIDAYCDTVIAGKADKVDKANKSGKADKAEKATKAKKAKAADDEIDDGPTDQPAEASADEPANGSDDAPVEAPTETAPDQQKSAPEAGKPAKKLPSQSNGNSGKDR